MSNPHQHTDHDWEQWGAQDPYFGVLTNPKFRRTALTDEAREEFFESGRLHIEHVLRVCRQHLDAGFQPQRALDFGCGVGRLLVALAREVPEVVGVDVSPSMLQEARRNCDARGASRVALLGSDDTLSQVHGDFDLVHSFIVLQHIAPARGRELVRQMLRRIRPGGVGALHLTFGFSAHAESLGQPPAPPPRAPTPKPAAGGDPTMLMHAYKLNEVMFLVQAAGATQCHVEFTDHGGALGTFLYWRMPGGAPARLAGPSPEAPAPAPTAIEPPAPSPWRYSGAFRDAVIQYEAGDGTARVARADIELYDKLGWMRDFMAACQSHLGSMGRQTPLRFLDVGCGTGHTAVAAALAGLQAQACDHLAHVCELARWRVREHGLNVPVFQWDLCDAVPPDQRAAHDFVYCAQVLEHIPRQRQFQALGHLMAMVAPGGLLYINAENARCPYDRHDTRMPLVRLLAPEQAASLARQLGRALDFPDPDSGRPVALHDYLSYDEILGAARVMGFEVLNPFMPYDSAQTLLRVLTGSDWLHQHIGRHFEVERYLPVSLLLRRSAA